MDTTQEFVHRVGEQPANPPTHAPRHSYRRTADVSCTGPRESNASTTPHPCHTDAPVSNSQPISYTSPCSSRSTRHWDTGRNLSRSNPSNTRPSNAIHSESSRVVLFNIYDTQPIKQRDPTHPTYTPKPEEPVQQSCMTGFIPP